MTAPAYKRSFRKRDEELDRYINLKLAALGLPVSRNAAGSDFLEIAGPLLRNYYQNDRQLGGWLCASEREAPIVARSESSSIRLVVARAVRPSTTVRIETVRPCSATF